MYLVNFSNQHAAGPKNIALNFFKLARETKSEYIFLLPDLPEFRALEYKSNISVQYVKKRFGIVGAIFNAIFLNYWYIPKILRSTNVRSVLAFGNFLSFSTSAKKIVLLHHPYLVDESLYQTLPIFAKKIEWLKRLLFSKTVKNVDVIVVQSRYMQECFKKCYPKEIDKTVVIPNPLSSVLANIKDVEFTESNNSQNKLFQILYVSRFYPHKNHTFLIHVSDLLEQQGFNHQFLVTVDPKLVGADSFLNKTKSNPRFNNIGELPQADLEMYYKTCDLFIFPSKSETFGNPIIEAMFFSCPLLLPNLGYASALAQSIAEFYKPDSVANCCEKIIKIATDSTLLSNMRQKSFEAGQAQLTSQDWFSLYYLQLEQKN